MKINSFITYLSREPINMTKYCFNTPEQNRRKTKFKTIHKNISYIFLVILVNFYKEMKLPFIFLITLLIFVSSCKFKLFN